jgi:hypothetical protein
VGPVAVSISAPGFQPTNETANIQGGQTAEVAVGLVRLEVRLPATVSGLIRSTQGGTPIAAVLEIPEIKLKLKADEKGAFSTKIKGGTYRVVISAPGYLTQVKSFTVKDGDQAIFNVDLYPARSGKARGKR